MKTSCLFRGYYNVSGYPFPSGPEFLNGYLGAQRIKEGSVATPNIHGEPDLQGVDILVERIQKLINLK